MDAAEARPAAAAAAMARAEAEAEARDAAAGRNAAAVAAAFAAAVAAASSRDALGIVMPPRLCPEASYDWTFDELPQQNNRVLAFSAGSGWRPMPQTGPISPDKQTGKERARILSVQYGNVPRGLSSILSGAGGSKEAQDWNDRYLESIVSEVHTERYGADSWIQRWAKGQACTADVRFLLRDWSLSARKFDIEPANEAAAARTMRVAKRDTFRAAIADLEALWDEEYTKATNVAVAEMGRSVSYKAERYRRSIALYDTNIGNPPQPTQNFQALKTAEQVESARTLPLAFMDKADRIKYWRDLFGRDELASHLSSSRDVVDLRRLVEKNQPGKYPAMLKNRFAHACDIIHIRITGFNENIARLRVYAGDVDIRDSANGRAPTAEAHRLIKELHFTLGHTNEIKQLENLPVMIKKHPHQAISRRLNTAPV